MNTFIYILFFTYLAPSIYVLGIWIAGQFRSKPVQKKLKDELIELKKCS